MKIVDQIKNLIFNARQDGSEVHTIEVHPEILELLRKELKQPKGAVSVDGTTILCLSGRQLLLLKAIRYAELRWEYALSPLDADTLFKAVSDSEMPALISIVVDQHCDERDMKDPADGYDASRVKELNAQLKELDIEHTPI